MAKIRTAFFCQNCGAQYSKWQGKCNSCGQWNTVVEEVVEKQDKKVAWEAQDKPKERNAKYVEINQIDSTQEIRLTSTDSELDNVLGGGIVPGSVTLLGGEPGIGKSTLLLQIALKLPYKTLYVSGEESQKQIKMRAQRIGKGQGNCYVLTETKTQNIFNQIRELMPQVLIVDSIQTLYTDYIDATAGSISQIRECTSELIKFAKMTGVPVILIGHITKDGAIAGPKILEHMVDTVLQFEGDRNHFFRILRALKNRFGSTSEMGIYQMVERGLQGVENPSQILLSKTQETLSGSAISAMMEGARPIMIETQSLVSSAVYGTPQRSATGFNAKRLNMLLAVLEKRAGFRLATKDVFLNITGGISIDDPATDLGVAMSILSSNEDIAIEKNICFAAEIGLGGEVRPVQRVEQRIAEAEKLGFEKIFISKYNKLQNEKRKGIEIIKHAKIEEVIEHLFG